MTDFFLPAGSVVKHGTTTAHLASILSGGLLPGAGRHALRSQSEATPVHQAVYVGGLAAYFGAIAAHSSLMKAYALEEPNLAELGELAEVDPLRIHGEKFAEPPSSLPVVLTIELRESVRLIPDEDFVGSSNKAEDIWRTYRSGGLVRPGGVPSSWIKFFEVPQPLELKADQQDDALNTLVNDCVLLGAGVAHVQERNPPEQYRVVGGPWTPESALSQRHQFSGESVKHLLTTPQMTDRNVRLFNLLQLQSKLQWIGREVFEINYF